MFIDRREHKIYYSKTKKTREDRGYIHVMEGSGIMERGLSTCNA